MERARSVVIILIDIIVKAYRGVYYFKNIKKKTKKKTLKYFLYSIYIKKICLSNSSASKYNIDVQFYEIQEYQCRL